MVDPTALLRAALVGRRRFAAALLLLCVRVPSSASAFPGSGIAGTTLTVMALTIRACRNLVSEYRAGRT